LFTFIFQIKFNHLLGLFSPFNGPSTATDTCKDNQADFSYDHQKNKKRSTISLVISFGTYFYVLNFDKKKVVNALYIIVF
jgi:hypothetical protein